MTRVAGIDVGNATTEIVITDTASTPPQPIAWDRAQTRGRKGSEASLLAAVDLLQRLERTHGIRADLVAVTPQRPVDTIVRVLEVPASDTGRLAILGAGRSTPAGIGLGVGRPVPVEDAPTEADGPTVLVASDPLGYRRTAALVQGWIDAGADVAGVLLAGDEAVLVSRRISQHVPVLDQMDVRRALEARLVALEVAALGRPARAVTDPVRLAALFDLRLDEHVHADSLARSVRGLSDVAVGLFDQPAGAGHSPEVGWVEYGSGQRVDLVTAMAVDDEWTTAPTLQLPGVDGVLESRAVSDMWGLDLTALAEDAVLRPGALRAHSLALASLAAPTHGCLDIAAIVETRSGRPVIVLADEASAARAGALSTPGAGPDAIVVDIGGGTIEVIRADRPARVLAGAGDLVTSATAELLGIARGQAEWVKRGASARVEGPHVVADEDGTRRFLDTSAPSGSVGWLVIPGPAGLLPFDRTLAPTEWRALRLRLKHRVLGDNIARATERDLRADVLVVGGPAGDDEVLDCVARALRHASPGRGDVAGCLGHRWAVAYGLAVLAATR